MFILDCLPLAGPRLQPLLPVPAASAGAARPERGRQWGRGPRGTAVTGGLVCTTPGPSLCRPHAAGRRALLPVGTRKAPHGHGADACGSASAVGMAEARAAGRGRLGGGVLGRAGLPERAQAPPLVITFTRARDVTSTPGRARVRATPGGALSRPPPPLSPKTSKL